MTEEDNYEKSKRLWIESQNNYIEELKFNRDITLRNYNHLIVSIEHEEKVLNDYLNKDAK